MLNRYLTLCGVINIVVPLSGFRVHLVKDEVVADKRIKQLGPPLGHALNVDCGLM